MKKTILGLAAGLILCGCTKSDDPGDILVAGVVLGETAKTLSPGETFTLTPIVVPADAVNKKLVWTSSKTEVASVSDGVVTAVAVGEAVITVAAGDGGKSASCTVTVEQSEIGMTVAADVNAVSLGIGGSGTATVQWGDGNTQTLELIEIPKTIKHTYAAATSERKITVTGNRITLLGCSDNQLTSLDLSKNPKLVSLECSTNKLTVLDLSKNTGLAALECSGNSLTVLDVSKNTELLYLYCIGNRISSLDVSKNTELQSLSCADNNLSSLDVSKNTELTYLSCSGDKLTTLDVSKNTKLTELSCSYSRLSTLDVSKNTALTSLYCSDNNLSALDLSHNTELRYLYCSENNLSALDLSKNTVLEYADCAYNNLNEAALNALFGTLHENQISRWSKYMYIYGNPGAGTCDRTIAEAKGWDISGY